MSLRVLHVLDHSVPLHSGYTFRTLSILREQRVLGWQTIQLTTPKQGASSNLREEVDGLVFHRTPNAAGTGLLAQMYLTADRLAAIVSETRPDLIHAHSPVLNALPSLWIGRRQRLPVVYEMRAAWEDAAVDHGTTREGSLRYRTTRAIETFALRHADQVTTICDGLRKDIAMRGVPGNRITVIPNAVDVSLFRFGIESDPELRRTLGLEGAIVIGFVGSFYAYEGLDLLIEATRRMAAQYPNLRVLLVGGGPEENHLKALAVAAGVQDRVVFLGRVPHGQVQRYYELIDVLAFPRRSMRLTELVTPLKPLEAMAQGRIVVASDVGGHRELIRHEKTGFLFRAGDPAALQETLCQVLSQREMWSDIRAQARCYVEIERTWAGSVVKYRDVYNRALSSHRVGLAVRA